MATIKQIQTRIQKLQKQADAIIARQAQKVVDQIRNLMLEHGLTTADIEAAARKRRQGAGLEKKSAASKGKVSGKYRNPKTGETWSGRARPPKWIANVKDRSNFLIEKNEALASGVVKAGAKRAVSKNAGVALYKDPDSGATWTGHGRAPGWIASASDRSVYLIGKAGKKAAAKKATAKKAIARKATAKKAIAKKATAKKATAKKTSAASKSARKTPPAIKRATASKKPIAAREPTGASDARAIVNTSTADSVPTSQ